MVSKRKLLDFEKQKIQNAQNSIIVIRQGLRLISSLSNIYEMKDVAENEIDIRRTLIPGETYLYLLASAQFVGGIEHGECTPFLLTSEKIESIKKLRNIWEHRAEFDISGPDAFKELHDSNKRWIQEKYKGSDPKVFTVSYFPGFTKIGSLIHVEEIIREAQEWHELVYHEKVNETLI